MRSDGSIVGTHEREEKKSTKRFEWKGFSLWSTNAFMCSTEYVVALQILNGHSVSLASVTKELSPQTNPSEKVEILFTIPSKTKPGGER